MADNKANFLRWDFSFNKREANIIVDNFSYPMAANQDSIVAPIVAGWSSTFPLDLTTLNIISYNDSTGSVTNALPSPSYDSESGNITIFRPYSTYTQASFTIRYTMSDVLGNVSPIGVMTVTLNAVVVKWIGYTPSYTCSIDNFGNKTGYAYYGYLVLVNASTNTPISPLQTKPNNVYDADYVSPVYDPGTCNVPATQYSMLTLVNNTTQVPNNYITITSVILIKTGNPNITLTINVAPGQSKQIAVPANAYDNVQVNFTTVGNPVNGYNVGGATLYYYWEFSTGGQIPVQVATFSGGVNYSYSNTTIPYPAGATLLIT